MFKFAQDGITVASMLDNRKPNKDQKFPVKIRVTHQGVRKYYSTGKDMLQDEWDKLPKTKSRAAAEVREHIQTSFDTVQKTVAFLIKEGDFSFDRLNVRLGRSVSGTVNAAFEAKIAQLKAEERVGTETSNKNALSSFEKFRGKKIAFSSVTVDWLKKYEKWMLEQDNSYTTIGMYVRALRAIVNDAVEAGYIKPNQYPFGEKKYQIPTGEGRKLALSKELIKKVVNYTDDHEVTERYRDLWVQSYLLNGVNMNDLLRLTDSKIKNGEIRFIRNKSIRTKKEKKEIVVDVNPRIQALFDRWGVPGRKPNEYIYPYLEGAKTAAEQKAIIRDVIKRTNKVLSRIGATLGLEDFTTYSARHSFATVLKRSGASISAIQEALGHEDSKTTENYMDSFEKEARQKNASYLTDFLDEGKEPSVHGSEQ